ncbi:MAG: helix-turn-helix domain-containing protein [Anaerorhabdus sp.]
MDIGNRIKQLRATNKLTLEELASRCELSKGFLSQLERNLTSPSIQTLQDIAEALGVSMAKFFQEEKKEKLIFSEEDFFKDEKEDSCLHWIVPNAQKNEMEPILLELKQGGESQKISPHEGEEFGYILSGKVKLYFGDSERYVKKGETFYISGNQEHYLKNESKELAKVLWVCTPPIF